MRACILVSAVLALLAARPADCSDVLTLTNDDFDTKIKALDGPVLVEFYAP